MAYARFDRRVSSAACRGGAVMLLLTVLLVGGAGGVHAEMAPETISVETLGTPQPSWFFAKAALGHASVFDAATGEMLGLVSLTPWTPAVEPNVERGEIYAAETYFSRRLRGDRNDVLTVYDLETLSPTEEIDLPDKINGLPFRHYIALLDDKRHLAVFNMTPAQSVSIVDIRDRQFVGELSTPGCALMLPVAKRGFLMLCGDGTLQLIRLDNRGEEAARLRSAKFFDIDEDPVFDKPVPTADGWQLVSFDGRLFDVTVTGDEINISEPWMLVTDPAEIAEGWRVGGGQVIAHQPGQNLLLALMHVGEVDTHEDPGTEVWVFDRDNQRRMARIPFEVPVTTIYLTPTQAPLLITANIEGAIDVYDVQTTRKLRTIANPGLDAAMLQGF